ncbi:MAG: sugar transferase, partial [Bacteroidota bacterium]
MASPRQKGTWLLVFVDLLTAAFAWTLFFIYRKIYFENPDFEWIQLQDENFQKGVTLIPLFWLILYIFWDSYKDMYRQSRMNALIRTFFQAAVGTVLLFFILLVDDT